jgi:hypothetical protein
MDRTSSVLPAGATLGWRRNPRCLDLSLLTSHLSRLTSHLFAGLELVADAKTQQLGLAYFSLVALELVVTLEHDVV